MIRSLPPQGPERVQVCTSAIADALRAAGLAVLTVAALLPAASRAGEVLYNGIELPSPWPPRTESLTREVMPVPYLVNPPGVIPIDVGRQLFVDDFLIEETDLKRTYHQAVYHPSSPVVVPEADKPWERGGEIGTAMTFSDGVWNDPQDSLFKMWYWGGRKPATTCYATSVDGIHWEKPQVGVRPGTNIVQTSDRDSSTVWLDPWETDPSRRFKMMLFPSPGENDYRHGRIEIYCSANGLSWGDPVATGGPTGDRTTIFYNPFRRVWVYSLRDFAEPPVGRCRRYWESPDLIKGAAWKDGEPTLWVGADRLDNPGGPPSELYNLDCVAYESLMIGLFSLMQGSGREKSNELFLGFSRDGFHWQRPSRQPFMPRSHRPGDWNFDYLQSAGGCCLVVGDRLYFYVGARSDDWEKPGAYRSTGLATLRRDGFASMSAGANGGI